MVKKHLENNYEYSKVLLHYGLEKQIPFIYASSAAVYGLSEIFDESQKEQKPLNVYGYSKWLFDQYMLRLSPSFKSQVVGFRYFNVYGPHEAHKGSMASVAYHFTRQLQSTGVVKLFEGYQNYKAGEQVRDFISIEDIVRVNLWFLKYPEKSGIFNIGTGRARSFNDVAKQLIKLYGKGQIEYIPFPDKLKGCYQSYTQANISALRKAGYEAPFLSLEEGLKRYYDWLITTLYGHFLK